MQRPNFRPNSCMYYWHISRARPLQATTSLVRSGSDLDVIPSLSTTSTFYIVRHSDFTPLTTTMYQLAISTSTGNVTVPQLGGSSMLEGRDSKIHVADYDVGGINLIYSTAEIYTWRIHGSKRILILYGGLGETHEFAVSLVMDGPSRVEGSGFTSKKIGRSKKGALSLDLEQLWTFILYGAMMPTITGFWISLPRNLGEGTYRRSGSTPQLL